MLLSLQSFISADRMVKKYEEKLNSDYSIIVVSNTKLNEDFFNENIDKYALHEEVMVDNVLESVKDTISKTNLALLKVSIPKFYQVKLTEFPTKKDLEELETHLNALTQISKVETFAKTHDNIYKMFLLAKGIVIFFAILLMVVSIFLIIKQIEVWHYQHSSRLHIMSLLGASTFMKSKSLFKLAIVNSVISSILVSVFFLWISKDSKIINALNDIGLTSIEFNFIKDLGLLMGASLSISIVILIIVLIRHND
jgi:cell division transport system permease protein